MSMKRPDDQSPVNLAGVDYIPVESINVVEFHELPNGEGKPEDKLPQFVLRLKSRRTTGELIVALITHSKAVWPD